MLARSRHILLRAPSLRSLLVLLLMLARTRVGLATSETDSGDSARLTAAEALFVEGRRLMAEGRTAEACRKFADSQALDRAPGTLLNWARCLEQIGRTASAWTAYREAAALARGHGQPERSAFALAQAQRLADELPQVHVEVPQTVAEPGLVISIDGKQWARSLWNVPVPIDSGRHTLSVRAPGFFAWSSRFEAKPKQVARLGVPPLVARPAEEPMPALEPVRGGWRFKHTAAVVGAGTTVVAVAVGTVLALEAQRAYEGSEAFCTQNQCQPQGLELREVAFDRARVATVAFSMGAASLVSAAVLWFSEAPPRAFVGPRRSEAGVARVLLDLTTDASAGARLGVRGQW